MFIDDVVWLPAIVDKLLYKHTVTQNEVEEVFLGRPRFRFQEKGSVAGEDMYIAFGQTESGRFLIIFFIHKPGNRALIISARDMSTAERRQYGRK